MPFMWLQSDRQRQRGLPRMRGIDLIRRVVIAILALSTFGSVALWWLSASSTYGSGYRDCGMKASIVPGWRVRFAISPQAKLIVYGQAGRVDLHSIWKDYSIEGIDKEKEIRQLRFGGFRYEIFAIGPNRARSVSAPFWFMVILFAAYPVSSFVRGPVKRWYRRRNSACLECGYNLTGNVSGVCPECGTASK